MLTLGSLVHRSTMPTFLFAPSRRSRRRSAK